jgi:hypothetical protein
MQRSPSHPIATAVLAAVGWFINGVMLASAQAPQPPKAAVSGAPDLLRIVVIDVSGSMNEADGNSPSRLDTARNEFKQSLKSLPATASTPVVLIPFSDDVLHQFVRIFADNNDLERFLDSLQPNGSTNIAAALKTAIDQAGQLSLSKNLMVFLYSDGGHNVGPMYLVYEQEHNLDRLFADRATKGLSQSVVVKRWGGVNGDMVAHLQKNPNVHVVDASELKLNTTSLTTSASIRELAWKDAAAGLVLVRLVAAIGGTTGAIPPRTVVTIKCLLPGCQWLAEPKLTVGEPAQTLELLVRLNPQGFDPAAKYTLPLQFQGPEVIATKQGLLLPIINPARLDCPLPLDGLYPSVQVKASLSQRDQPQWKDPFQQLGSWPMKLRLEPTFHPPVSWPQKVRWVLSGLDGAETVNPKTVLLENRPLEVDLIITRRLSSQEIASANPVALQVRLTASPDSKTCKLSSNQLTATATVGLPPTQTTRISQQISSVGQPQWTDLTAGVVTVPVRLDLTIDGMLSPGAVLGLLPCRDVVAAEGVPVRVHSGSQTVEIKIAGKTSAASSTINWTLQLEPPQATYGTRYVPPAPVNVTFVVPPPFQIVLADNRNVLKEITCAGGAVNQAIAGGGLVKLAGEPAAPAAAGNLRIRGFLKGPIVGSGFSNIHLGQQVSWAMRPSDPSIGISWWHDVHVKGSLVILPENAPPHAVQGSVMDVTIVYEAVYKKLAFYLALGLGTILVGFVLFHLVKMCVADGVPRRSSSASIIAQGDANGPVA